MKTKKVLYISLPILSLLLHSFALLLFWRSSQSFALPPDWTLDFLVLISISAVTTIGMHIIERPVIRWPISIIRVICFYLIGIPFGDFLDIEYLLLFSILMDTGFLFHAPAGIVLSVVIVSGSMLLQLPMSIYAVQRPAPELFGLSLYALIGCNVAFLTIFLRNAVDRIEISNSRMDSLNDIISRLMGANRGYLEYASQVEKETTESERTRIIQELHDVVGKAFTNMYAMMDASIKHPPDNNAEDLELHVWVREQAQIGLSETRAVLYRLREIQDASLAGIDALNNLISTFRKATRTDVTVSWGNLPWEIAPAADQIIYSSIQESLVNSFRHGKASKIHIQFWIDESGLIVDVADNGGGAVHEKKGIGQSGMERRITGIGGLVTFVGGKNGYRVRLTIPRDRIFPATSGV